MMTQKTNKLMPLIYAAYAINSGPAIEELPPFKLPTIHGRGGKSRKSTMLNKDFEAVVKKRRKKNKAARQARKRKK